MEPFAARLPLSSGAVRPWNCRRVSGETRSPRGWAWVCNLGRIPRFHDVFARQPRKQRKLETGDLLDDDDGYIEKISRWKAQALAALESGDFWARMVVLHVARGPVIHLTLWLQSAEARLLPLILDKATAVEELPSREQPEHPPGPRSLLGKVDQIPDPHHRTTAEIV